MIEIVPVGATVGVQALRILRPCFDHVLPSQFGKQPRFLASSSDMRWDSSFMNFMISSPKRRPSSVLYPIPIL